MSSSRTRWDETWHRLRDWTNGSAPSERLAHLILLSEGYTDLDPSHPLGGPDGGKDAVCARGGMPWVVAVYFPRGQQPFRAIKKKFLDDLRGAAAHAARGIAFVTNQELSLAERGQLRTAAGEMAVEPYHLERITTILDQPHMAPVRRQFLSIDDGVAESTVTTPAADPAALRASVWLEPTASLVGRGGAAVAPVSWSLRLPLELPSRPTKAELHEAIQEAVVHFDLKDYGRSARWPRLLVLPDVQPSARPDGSQLWELAYRTDAQNEVGDEQLALSPDGVLAFQRDTLSAVEKPAANIGLMADDVLYFLVLASNFARRFSADGRVSLELFLRVPSSRDGTLALFIGTSVDHEQPHRIARLPAPRIEVNGKVEASVDMLGSAAGVTATAKRLIDSVANEFALDASAMGNGPSFMSVAADSLARRLQHLGIRFP